jgi:hypothetical protein
MPWITLPEALSYVGNDKDRLQAAFVAGDVKTRMRYEDGTVRDLNPKKWRRGAEIDWQGSLLDVAKRDHVISSDPSPRPRFVPVEVDLSTLLQCFPAAIEPGLPAGTVVKALDPTARGERSEKVLAQPAGIGRKGRPAPWTKSLRKYMHLRIDRGDDIASMSLGELRTDFLSYATRNQIRKVPNSRSALDEQIKKARQLVIAERQASRDV